MANRYSNWNSASCYSHKEKVLRGMENRMERYFLQTSEGQMVTKKTKPCENIEKNYFNIIELEAICRICSSVMLSFNQLFQYLCLQGYNIRREELKDFVARLCDIGILEKIYIENSLEEKLKNGKYEKMICHMASKAGKEIARKIGAEIRKEDDYEIINSLYRTKELMRIGMIINQIILNQLYYNNNLISFEVFRLKSISKKDKYCSQLCLNTKHRKYFFEYMDSKKKDFVKVKEIINKYKISNKKGNVLIVFVVDNCEDYLKLSRYIANENKEGLIFAFTDIDKWFSTGGGELITWTYLDEQMMKVIIKEL